MASTWISDIINDFIHSSIWLSPIETFLDRNCACFDYDDDIQPSSALLHEQGTIFKAYRNLVDSLITSLCDDLKLDLNELKEFYQKDHSSATDDSYEQLYSANDFDLFVEMMKRKNLILQLQALVNLQLDCGLLQQSETTDDRVLQLLLQATSSAPRKANVATTQSNLNVSDQVLREKLRELSVVDESNASARSSRENFLKEQRDLIINQQRNERARELEKEIPHARPQSAAQVARKAMETSKEQISNDELEKRRALAAKLRREVVDKR